MTLARLRYPRLTNKVNAANGTRRSGYSIGKKGEIVPARGAGPIPGINGQAAAGTFSGEFVHARTCGGTVDGREGGE
jgi:hypothetical protein